MAWMWLVVVGWLYVALMMALADAMHPQGGVLSGIFTFLMYGVGPLALVLYLLGAPARRQARRQAEAAAGTNVDAEVAPAEDASANPDAGHQPTGDAVAAKREEP